MNRFLSILILGVFLLTQACQPASSLQVDQDSPLTEESLSEEPSSPADSTPQPTPMPGSTPQPSPTPEPLPSVRVIAFDGNLYIRRGPGTEYNRIGLLKKGESAQVIGQDVLSKWVQVIIPNTEFTGWVSLLTPFTKIEGDLSRVDSFTFTEWPLPAYIKNCTEHDIMIEPVSLYLYSLYTNSKYLNEVQIDPGTYDVYDLFLPDGPKIQTVDIQEGETFYITVDGAGTEHLCP
jgi:hypothetical protein